MGDRCYMRVTCSKQDAARFEELGFSIDDDQKRGSVVELFEVEANYAHEGEMPTDIPYHGWHGSGGEYGSCQFACDGENLCYVDVLQNGGPAVEISESGIDGESHKRALRYFTALEKANCMLEQARRKNAVIRTKVKRAPQSDFIERNGRWTCRHCGYELSAMLGDNEIPTRCKCRVKS